MILNRIGCSLIALLSSCTGPREWPTVRTEAGQLPPVATLDEAAWHRLAFGLAEYVVGIQVVRGVRTGVYEVRVEHEVRGYRTARVMRLEGLEGQGGAAPEIGSKWIVATTDWTSDPRYTLAQLPDTPPNRERAQEWAGAPWKRTPLLALVRVTPSDVVGWNFVFDVVEVLRGPIDWARLVDEGSDSEMLRPLEPKDALHLLAAWSLHTYSRAPYPVVDISSLTPVTESELAEIRSALLSDPYAERRAERSAARGRLRELCEAWAFHSAPLVAETRIGGVYEEATGAGGQHYMLQPERWLRGESDCTPPATEVALPMADGLLGWPDQPYLFHGGGHAYHGPERVGDRYLTGGWEVQGFPTARLPLTSENRAAVDAWISANPPRAAAQPVDPTAFAERAPTDDELAASATFEPDIAIATLDLDDGRPRRLDLGRFEVVRRRTIELDEGQSFSWLHLRAVRDRESSHGFRNADREPPPEWMVSGIGLPEWQPGSIWAGCTIDARLPEIGGYGSARKESTPWADGRLLVWSTCIPSRDPRALTHVLGLMRRADSVSD